MDGDRKQLLVSRLFKQGTTTTKMVLVSCFTRSDPGWSTGSMSNRRGMIVIDLERTPHEIKHRATPEEKIKAVL